jgi:hypothetical protein
MNASWASALVAIIVMLCTATVALLRAGRHEGKIEAILEQLKEIAVDHEGRIREVERHLPAITGRGRS